LNQKKTKVLIKMPNSSIRCVLCGSNVCKAYFFVSNKDEHISRKAKTILALAGSLVGFLNGFFGGGGGMVCVPLLQKILRLNTKESHATAIMVIFPLSLISATIYLLNGYIEFYPVLTVGLGVFVGGIVGSFALKWLPPKTVRIIFAIIMFAGGIKLIIWVY